MFGILSSFFGLSLHLSPRTHMPSLHSLLSLFDDPFLTSFTLRNKWKKKYKMLWKEVNFNRARSLHCFFWNCNIRQLASEHLGGWLKCLFLAPTKIQLRNRIWTNVDRIAFGCRFCWLAWFSTVEIIKPSVPWLATAFFLKEKFDLQLGIHQVEKKKKGHSMYICISNIQLKMRRS